ncbi:MAG: FliM/FliN family flagellar motor switch protein [Acidobacteriota bacterium]|nr:FliM/FliN family flagellar motor switch protein [Acidobacteriota bacterium]
MAAQGSDPIRALLEGVAAQFGEAVATLIGKASSVTKRLATVDAGWLVRVQVAGRLRGTLSIGLSSENARAIARLVMGLDEDPPDPAVRDTLEELTSQACGAVAQQPAGESCQFTIEQVGAVEQMPGDEPLVFEATFGDALKAHLALWNAVAVVEQPAAAAAARPGAAKPAAPADNNLDVILDIDLPMVVRFGETRLPLQVLVEFGPGSVIDLGRSPDEPVDVLVSGKLVARGEVVVVGGNYGVRITEVASRVDRIRQMGA